MKENAEFFEELNEIYPGLGPESAGGIYFTDRQKIVGHFIYKKVKLKTRVTNWWV